MYRGVCLGNDEAMINKLFCSVDRSGEMSISTFYLLTYLFTT